MTTSWTKLELIIVSEPVPLTVIVPEWMHCKFCQKVLLEMTTGPFGKHEPCGTVCANTFGAANFPLILREKNCIKNGEASTNIIAIPKSKLFFFNTQKNALFKILRL